MKSVFITGGTTGIGQELAKLYLEKGWKVGVCGRSREKFSESFEAESNVEFYQVDVAENQQVQEAIEDYSARYGLDLIIANAGIAMSDKSGRQNLERNIQVINTNVLGVLYTFDAALKYMLPRKKGHMVAVSSIAAFNGLPGVSAYSASKAAVEKYCESLGVDLHSKGIAVTCICPGFIDTPLTKVNKHPMPFLMTAPEAAKKIYSAIEKKKHRYIFPFMFGNLVLLLSFLPRGLYHKVIGIYKTS